MSSLHHTQRPIAGFTLIEVMITVAVIAILAAVALPNYFEYVTRSRIVEAKTNLADMRTRLEQYFLDNRAYPAGPGNCIASAPGPAAPGNIYLPGSQKFFNVTCTAMSPTAYTVTAAGVGSMLGFVYSVDQANTRLTTSTGAWGKASPPNCWISKKSGEC
ncbi:MAG: type IV pilin protein [Casimicrobiaceae bacterium]